MKDEKTVSEILKIDEAARYLGVTRRWVYRRIASGDISASKVGGFYFIRRQDLDAVLDQGRQAGSVQDKGEMGPLVMKCGVCFRMLETDSLVGEVCEAQDCEELICSQCWREGRHYCIRHEPDRETLWQAATQKLRAGEISVLVKSLQARLREVNFLQRLHARLSAINTLRHPLSDDLVTIQNWDTLRMETDERSEIMKLLNKVVLEADWTAQTPLNVTLRYEIPAGNKQKTFPMAVQVQVLSHAKAMLQQGFDTQPVGVEELTSLLLKLGERAQAEQTFTLLLLASTTGWDAEACQWVRGGAAGTAFAHRWLLVYLHDLEKREMTYNRLDSRTRAYADLFSSILPEEDVEEVMAAIEKEIGFHESLTLAQAQAVFSYPQKSIEKAFTQLAASGRFALTEVPGLGPAIVRI